MYFVELSLFPAFKVMIDSFVKQLVPIAVIIVILRVSDISLSFAVGSTQTNVAAKQIADCMHEVFEINLGFNRLQKLYDSLSCVNQDTDIKRLLYSITEPAAARLNASVRFLQDLSNKVQKFSSETHHHVNDTQCCRGLNDTSGSTIFSDRLRSLVDLTTGCSIRQLAFNGSQESFKLNNELSNGFKDNFHKSSVVAWQYYGSVDGEYVQYPANTRYCEGSTSVQLDPRFK